MNGATQKYAFQFNYDAAGNRLWQKRHAAADTWESYVECSYNSANQIIAEDKYDTDSRSSHLAQTEYTFDAAGNMTQKELDDLTEANLDELWDYYYNAENRQTKVDKDSATVGLYTYSALGNRVQKVANSITTKMYYDGADCVGDYDGTNTSTYVTPSLDENLLLQRSSSDYYYTQDGLGSAREVLDASQATQNTYDYEAFGSFYGTPAENVANRYTYTGREWDSESGQYYYRARDYHPTTGRFTGRDPIELPNLYLYAGNRAVMLKDPYGALDASGVITLVPNPAGSEKDIPIGQTGGAKDSALIYQFHKITKNTDYICSVGHMTEVAFFASTTDKEESDKLYHMRWVQFVKGYTKIDDKLMKKVSPGGVPIYEDAYTFDDAGGDGMIGNNVHRNPWYEHGHLFASGDRPTARNMRFCEIYEYKRTYKTYLCPIGKTNKAVVKIEWESHFMILCPSGEVKDNYVKIKSVTKADIKNPDSWFDMEDDKNNKLTAP